MHNYMVLKCLKKKWVKNKHHKLIVVFKQIIMTNQEIVGLISASGIVEDIARNIRFTGK